MRFFVSIVSAFYAVATSAFIHIYQTILNEFQPFDRSRFVEFHRSINRISVFFVRNIYLRWRILCRFPLFLVWVGLLGSAGHTQAAGKDFAHGVIGRAEPCGGVEREPWPGALGVFEVGTNGWKDPKIQRPLGACNALWRTADSDKTWEIWALHKVQTTFYYLL